MPCPPPEFQKQHNAQGQASSKKEAAFSEVTSNSLTRSQLDLCVPDDGVSFPSHQACNSLCCGISILNKVLIMTSSELKGEVAMITPYSFK